MVVLSVVTLLAAAAAAGFRRNEFSTQYARFVADVEGTIVLARNAAIDRQTEVEITVDGLEVVVTVLNPATNVWDRVHAVSIASPTGTLIGSANAVCIYGFTAGVQTPKQAVLVSPPSDCLGSAQALRFEPDGRLEDPYNIFAGVPNAAGATLWIADRTLASAPRYAIIQIFPGGLVRKFEDLE